MKLGEVRALVLMAPDGKAVKNLESLKAVKDDLEALGLFQAGAMTLKGRIAHYCAAELNAKRGFYRRVDTIRENLSHWVGIYDLTDFDKACSSLITLGILEEDSRYTKSRALRIKI